MKTMSRKEKKDAAAARRLEWRARWSKMARAELEKGKTVEHAVRSVVGADIEKLAEQSPQLRSEIIRAGNEFLNNLAKAVVRVAEAK